MDTQSAAKLPFNLKIIQTDVNGIPKLAVPFIAMFNPDQFSVREEVELDKTVSKGAQGADPKPIGIKPREFTLELTLDGTGVNTNGVKIPVTAQVLLFRAATTSIVGETHRPPYLLVQYGTFISSCTLRSSTVTYTMFDMFGLPIRAKISASFVERTVAALGNIVGMLSSPDLTHRVEVKDGDILPLLTFKTCNNQNYYLQVARVNKLKNFRKLKAGTTLSFPPLSKT
ncbi:MAG: LysM peptidoglycan-binding domain-containing protein [Chlorobium sp.]|nr:MAG: LysM peptidoglycan-binding domain-containing protein [Chlorobium sp.]